MSKQNIIKQKKEILKRRKSEVDHHMKYNDAKLLKFFRKNGDVCPVCDAELEFQSRGSRASDDELDVFYGECYCRNTEYWQLCIGSESEIIGAGRN